MMKKQHIHSRIADRLFYFHRKELRTLRSKCRYIDEDLTNGTISKMTRHQLVEKLVGFENGEGALKRYLTQVKQWDKMFAFVGYRTLAN